MFKIHITLVVVAAILLLAAVRTFLLLSERRVVSWMRTLIGEQPQ